MIQSSNVEDVVRRGVELLDRVYATLTGENPDVFKAMDELVLGLRDVRKDLPLEDWELFSRSLILQHPSINLYHQDPFTRRCFKKPRGYEGDAETIDFIYGYINVDDYKLNRLAKNIHDYCVNSPACKAVRARMKIIAKKIDEVAEKVENPRIFSLACGHLREAHISKAIQEGRIKELVAMDYDRKSLEVVAKEFSGLKVRTAHGSVRDIILAEMHGELGKFDFIYAAGLYDYLSQGVATRLSEKLFDMLNHGGTLLLANFMPHIKDVGYMETFMDWRLIYRNEHLMDNLITNIPELTILNKKLCIEENGNIAFLEIVKGANKSQFY